MGRGAHKNTQVPRSPVPTRHHRRRRPSTATAGCHAASPPPPHLLARGATGQGDLVEVIFFVTQKRCQILPAIEI